MDKEKQLDRVRKRSCCEKSGFNGCDWVRLNRLVVSKGIINSNESSGTDAV